MSVEICECLYNFFIIIIIIILLKVSFASLISFNILQLIL